MPRTNEKAFNYALAEVLRNKHPLWKESLSAERSRVIQGVRSKSPDIILSLPGCSPVVVEIEFMPATTVQSDAKSRLGDVLSDNLQPIEHCIALRVPNDLSRVSQHMLASSIENSTFSYCLFSILNENHHERWPNQGWLQGGINDVALCMEAIALTESLVIRSTKILESGVAQAAAILSTTSEDVQSAIAKQLCQSPGEQTNRMAGAVIANAVIFHSRIEGTQGVATLSSLESLSGLSKRKILHCWLWIVVNVNYWPIFKIASDLLDKIPTREAALVLNSLHKLADSLTFIGVTGLNDLSGRMFQKLISDRKFLATFYTLPVSAAFLAELVVSRLKIDWKDAETVKSLRVADFACGTGTLIAALYQAIVSRFRREGMDDRKIHSEMMENALFAFDIMPAATHLTASTLSNMHPSVPFVTTRIVTMPYGYDLNQIPHIGSLELLKNEHVRSLLSLGRHQLAGRKTDGTDQISNSPAEIVMNSEVDHDVDIPHEALDIVIMNPPFTSPTNHAIANVPIPSFAGFSTQGDEQRGMSNRLNELKKFLTQPAGHGNAGLASNFIDLAHVKLKPGGLLGLVLPATFVAGSSWKNARRLLNDNYQDIAVISLTSVRKTEGAFSADTDMAEVLLIAKKTQGDSKEISNRKSSVSPSLIQFVNLRNRPSNHVEAYELAKFVNQNRGKFGDGRVLLGSGESNGTFLNMPGFKSGYAGLSDSSLARFMLSLSQGNFLSTRTNEVFSLPIINLGSLGKRGIGHRDLTGKSGNKPRGPFNQVPLISGGVPTYPTLWRHHTNKERYLYVEPDYELQTRPGLENQAAEVWKRNATKLHMNLDFGLNSNSLAACLTFEKSLGGRAWPNFILDDPRYEKFAVLWFNSTLGLMSHWWEGTKQHLGRSIVTISRLASLLTIDPRNFDDVKLAKIDEIFEEFSKSKFLRASECFNDSNRIALDKALLVELLGLPEYLLDDFKVIRNQWCAEPKVHGGRRKS